MFFYLSLHSLACLVFVKISALILTFIYLYIIWIIFPPGCVQYFFFVFTVQPFEFDVPRGRVFVLFCFFPAPLSLCSPSGIPVLLMLDYLIYSHCFSVLSYVFFLYFTLSYLCVLAGVISIDLSSDSLVLFLIMSNLMSLSKSYYH